MPSRRRLATLTLLTAATLTGAVVPATAAAHGGVAAAAGRVGARIGVADAAGRVGAFVSPAVGPLPADLSSAELPADLTADGALPAGASLPAGGPGSATAAAVAVAGMTTPPAPGRAPGAPGTAGAPGDGRAASWLTPDLVRDLGYEPTVADGHPENPGGGCSSPVPLPARFEPACRTHDLGYDLLRVAGRRGEPVPPAIRRGLDRQLADRMHAACDAAGRAGHRAGDSAGNRAGGASGGPSGGGPGAGDDGTSAVDHAMCTTAATAAATAVTLNSVRQHDGVPVDEHIPWSTP
ncbi:hypothetical protein QDW14_09500 [Corynebacterium bovis]|uniref:hypothetical protein n=1 Tax=Corynebacterium bovis TaxID=36808 RepID=UPI00244BC967|nr:hypothetical protein [Corynebacterium bovis]MDH2456697.1 hypothetical protein [Corynebacterium bovis]